VPTVPTVPGSPRCPTACPRVLEVAAAPFESSALESSRSLPLPSSPLPSSSPPPASLPRCCSGQPCQVAPFRCSSPPNGPFRAARLRSKRPPGSAVVDSTRAFRRGCWPSPGRPPRVATPGTRRSYTPGTRPQRSRSGTRSATAGPRSGRATTTPKGGRWSGLSCCGWGQSSRSSPRFDKSSLRSAPAAATLGSPSHSSATGVP
jgi:hypothetical protein